jgi:hypothetical protein
MPASPEGEEKMRITIALLLSLAVAASAPLAHADNQKGQKAGSVRVYRFDNLDIEGHVKTPHLMYFLKRIKNKFRAFRLPRQNFSRRILQSGDSDFLK